MPFQFPYELRTSRQGAPVRVRHNTPLIIWRWSHQRPPRRGVRSGSNGSNRAHSASVKSWRSCTGDAYRTRASRSERHALRNSRRRGTRDGPGPVCPARAERGDAQRRRRGVDAPAAAQILQALVDAEATAHIGAARHERTDNRTTQRNGSRDKVVSTTAGDLTVRIPKTRTGSFFPSLLAPRRRIDVALHAVVMEAYVHGVSTRKVDDLVTALGVESGISKSEVSRICAELDADVAAFTTRALQHTAFPYVFLDATYCKARLPGPGGGVRGGRVAAQAVVIATGVSIDGAARSLAARSVTARPRTSGPSSCAGCATA